MSQLVIEKDKTSGVEDENEINFVIAEEQPEGGFTITVPNIPEIVTECEDEKDIADQFLDAFRELYRSYLLENEEFPYEGNSFMFEIKVIRLDRG